MAEPVRLTFHIASPGPGQPVSNFPMGALFWRGFVVIRKIYGFFLPPLGSKTALKSRREILMATFMSNGTVKKIYI